MVCSNESGESHESQFAVAVGSAKFAPKQVKNVITGYVGFAASIDEGVAHESSEAMN